MKKLSNIVLTVGLLFGVLWIVSALRQLSSASSPTVNDQLPAVIAANTVSPATDAIPTKESAPESGATATPGIEDESLWTPTPQARKPGMSDVSGRLICKGEPLGRRWVYLLVLDGDSALIEQAILTDDSGRWLFRNVAPGTYAVVDELPKSTKTALANQREIGADQAVDFGDAAPISTSCN